MKGFVMDEIELGSGICPNCKSYNCEFGNINVTSNKECVQLCSCLKCGCLWFDCYKFYTKSIVKNSESVNYNK